MKYINLLADSVYIESASDEIDFVKRLPKNLSVVVLQELQLKYNARLPIFDDCNSEFFIKFLSKS